MGMNREILRLALPNVVSNITVPIMGIAGTVIAGQWGGSAATIGALAVGVSIFNFIYWNCGFIRMGTSGLTAQAFGAGDMKNTTLMLARAVFVSFIVGFGVLILQRPIGLAAIRIMHGDDLVAAYFFARIWAVPAGVMLFGLNGWLTGMQNAIIPMIVAIAVNVIHIACSVWFAFGFDMGIVGIAYASVVAQWTGLTVTILITWLHYRRRFVRITWREVMDFSAMREFFVINRDIIIRTLCIVAAYTFFTAASARMDDPVLLAVNTILLQLFTLFLFIDDKTTDAQLIIDYAGRYIGWVIAIPLIAAMPFVMDGVMVGATQSRIMRDSMLIATIAYFAIFYALHPIIGNNALWLAFTSFMLLRGIFEYLMSRRLQIVYIQAESNK